jgi:hypothetical protein
VLLVLEYEYEDDDEYENEAGSSQVMSKRASRQAGFGESTTKST